MYNVMEITVGKKDVKGLSVEPFKSALLNSAKRIIILEKIWNFSYHSEQEQGGVRASRISLRNVKPLLKEG